MEQILSWHTQVPRGGIRRILARALRLFGRALAGWSRRLAPPARPPQGDPVLEFYAEAGAPEGALYVDGRLVAVLPGVTRL
jgi:hypothetical protein